MQNAEDFRKRAAPFVRLISRKEPQTGVKAAEWVNLMAEGKDVEADKLMPLGNLHEMGGVVLDALTELVYLSMEFMQREQVD